MCVSARRPPVIASRSTGSSKANRVPPRHGVDAFRLGCWPIESRQPTRPGITAAKHRPASATTGSSLREPSTPRRVYLAGVTVDGALRDVFFVTTTYGETIAVDADEGSDPVDARRPITRRLGGFASDRERDAASPIRIASTSIPPLPTGYIQKLAVEDGHALNGAAPLPGLPQREKIAASLRLFRRPRGRRMTGG